MRDLCIARFVGFVEGADGNGRPDSWTSSSKLTRSAESVHGGLYSGRFYATDDSSVTIKQYVAATAGATYGLSGWVNIPPTADTFTFKVQLKFQNEAGSVIGIYLLRSYSAATAAWDYSTITALAPAGAVTAYVQIDASSLAGAMYVDDLSLTRR